MDGLGSFSSDDANGGELCVFESTIAPALGVDNSDDSYCTNNNTKNHILANRLSCLWREMESFPCDAPYKVSSYFADSSGRSFENAHDVQP